MKRLLAHFDVEATDQAKKYGEHIHLDQEPKNCVVSLTSATEDVHLPMLDDDAGIFRVIPSRTPGHQHVYIDRPLNWDQCVRLLKVLIDLELVDRAWGEKCIDQRVMTLRLSPDDPHACTGMSARWCPVHGDCTCEGDEPGLTDHEGYDHTCPLHGVESTHAEAYLES